MLGRVVIILLVFTSGIITGISLQTPKESSISTDFILTDISTPNHEEELYYLLRKYKVQNRMIVLAQAKLESANFTTDRFLKDHNFVNMKPAGQRPTSSKKSEEHSYAVYSDLSKAILDYALWQCSYARNLTEEQYYNKLVQVGFAEDTLYINKLKPIVTQLKLKYGE